MTKSIYNLRSGDYEGESYVITKFDHGLEMESTYRVSLSDCECPQFQGRQKLCRHMKMLPMFLALARQDTEYFLDYDTKTWHRPLLPEYEMEYHDILVRKLSEPAIEAQPSGIKVIPIQKASIITHPPAPGAGLATSTALHTLPVEVAPITGEVFDRESEPRLATKGEPPTEADVQRVASAPLVAPIKRRRI